MDKIEFVKLFISKKTSALGMAYAAMYFLPPDKWNTIAVCGLGALYMILDFIKQVWRKP